MNNIKQIKAVIAEINDFAFDLDSLSYELNSDTLGHRSSDLIQIASRLSAIVEQMGMEPDMGPWVPNYDGRLIQSDDFNHDVTLRVSGDFATDEDRIAYTKWLAAKLNATPQVPDGMVLVPKEPTVDMIIAGNRAMGSAHSALHTVRGCYRSMIAAAKEEGINIEQQHAE